MDSRPTVSFLPGPRLAATLLVLAPLLEVVEAGLSPLVGSSTAADLTAISAHPGRFALSATIGLAGTVLLVPAFFGLLKVCVVRTPRVATVAAWVMFGCMLGFVAVRTSQAVQLQAVRQQLPTPQAVALLEGMFTTPIGAPLITLFLLGNVVGLALVAASTWRAGLPKVGSILLVVFLVLETVGFDANEVMTVISHAALLVANALFARALWSGRSTSSIVVVTEPAQSIRTLSAPDRTEPTSMPSSRR